MVMLARVQETIAAPADAIWALLVDFENPQKFAKTIEKCSIVGQGIGAVRTIHARGHVIQERLVEANRDSYRFSYVIVDGSEMPVPGMLSYQATVVLKPTSDKMTAVDWRGDGEVDGPLAPITETIVGIYGRAIAAIRAALAAAA